MLLSGQWTAITGGLHFGRAPLDEVVQYYLDGRGAYFEQEFGIPVKVSTVTGDLVTRLEALLPIMSFPSKHLFMSVTADDGTEWTTRFDNGYSQLGARVSGSKWPDVYRVSIRDLPDTTVRERPREGFEEMREISITEPDPNAPQGRKHSWITMAHLESGWEYFTVGDLPFPNPANPQARRVRDRFTHHHLEQAVSHLGLHPFDHTFYETGPHAILIEEPLPPPGVTPVTMTLAQANLGGRGVYWDYTPQGEFYRIDPHAKPTKKPWWKRQ